MALQDLASNPLFDTEDADDDNDRRLATTSAMPRTRKSDREPELFKKKTAKPAPVSRGMRLAGGKLFGQFDAGMLTGEDEVGLQRPEAPDATDFVINSPTERKKKEIAWGEAPVIGREDWRLKSIEKHEQLMQRQAESKFLAGLLNQTLLFKDDDDFEIVVAGDKKPSFSHSQALATQGGATQSRPATGAMIATQEASRMVPESDNRSLLQQSGLSSMVLKRPFEGNFRDRNDLKKVLTKSLYDRRKLATEDDLKRIGVETDFTKADEDPDRAEEASDREDNRQETGKMDIMAMAALEEGGGQDDEADESWEPEEGFDQVKAEIEKIEKMMMSDDEATVEKVHATPQKEKEADFSSPGSNYLDQEAEDENGPEDGEEEEDEDFDPENEDSGDGDEAIEEEEEKENTESDGRIMKRLKKIKDVREARREAKRAKRLERHAKFLENEKRRKQIMKNGDIYDQEADLGEVVDGRDAGVKDIDVRASNVACKL